MSLRSKRFTNTVALLVALRGGVPPRGATGVGKRGAGEKGRGRKTTQWLPFQWPLQEAAWALHPQPPSAP